MPIVVARVIGIRVERTDHPAETIFLIRSIAELDVIAIISTDARQAFPWIFTCSEIGDVAGIIRLHETVGNVVVRIQGVV